MKKFLTILQSFAGIFVNTSLSKPSIFSVCDDLDCDSGICNVVIPQCVGDDFGQEIVKIFVAKNEAADFSSVADLALIASWQTKLGYDCTGANADDRIVVIGNLYDGIKPPSENETQPAPYGVTELVNSTHTITFAIKRWDATLIDSINDIRCRNSVKFWYLTDTGWLFGGITGYENSSIVWGHIEHNGPGGGKVKSSNTITWKGIDQSVPVYIPTLAAETN